MPVSDWPSEENPAQRTRWGMFLDCTEPQPTSTKLRVADEMPTFFGEAAFENEQSSNVNAMYSRRLCRVRSCQVFELLQVRMEDLQRMNDVPGKRVRTD